MTPRPVVLAFACLAALSSCKKKPPGITVVAESETERAEMVKAAFVEGSAGSGSRIEPGTPDFSDVDAFIGRFGAAARQKDRATYRTCLSVDAMVRNLEAKGMIQFKTGRERGEFIKGAEGSIGKSMGNLAFDRHVLARLEQIAPNQMMAFTRAFDDELKVVTKMRWWLVKEEGAWKIYDFEELSQGVRASTMMGAMVGGLKGRRKPWVQPLMDMTTTLQGMTGDNMMEKLAAMRDLSKKVLENSPPPEVEAFARQTLVSGMMANGDSAGALVELEQLEKLPNPSPGIHFMMGCALSATGKPAEAHGAFARYVEILGWDSDVYEVVADAFLSEGKRDEALDHALKGLADQKDATGCLATGTVAAGAARLGELEKHFDASSDQEGTYQAVIEYALQCEDVETGRAVLDLLKKKQPASELVAHYEEIFAGEE